MVYYCPNLILLKAWKFLNWLEGVYAVCLYCDCMVTTGLSPTMAGDSDKKRGASPLKSIFAKKSNTQNNQKGVMDHEDHTELLRTLVEGQKAMRGDSITANNKCDEIAAKQGKMELGIQSMDKDVQDLKTQLQAMKVLQETDHASIRELKRQNDFSNSKITA